MTYTIINNGNHITLVEREDDDIKTDKVVESFFSLKTIPQLLDEIRHSQEYRLFLWNKMKEINEIKS